MRKRLQKSIHKRTVTGVVGGLADYFGLDYAWAKVIFVILVLLTEGWLMLGYAILALIMPAPQTYTDVGRRYMMGRGWYIGLYFINFWRQLKLVLTMRPYSQIFGFVFLVLGVFWVRPPLALIPTVLLILGAILLFDPFGLTKRKQILPYLPYPAADFHIPHSGSRLN